MSDDHETDIDGKEPAPASYAFKDITGLVYTKKYSEDEKGGFRYEYLASIKIYDDKYIRTIYTSGDGFDYPGLDAINEASRRDRERPIDQRREPQLISALLAGINKKAFFGEPWTLESFLLEVAKFINGELPIDWPLSAIGDFLDAGRELVPTVRVSHEMEKQKIRFCDIGETMDMFNEEIRADVEKFNIAEPGLDLDEAEEDAFFGVQTLFSDNGLKANYNKDGNNAFYFKMSDLCRVCGVPIITDKRGRNQYSGRDRERLVSALQRLSDKKRLFQFETPDPRNAENVIGVEYVKPVWNLAKFYNKKKRGKKKLVIGYAICEYDDTLMRDIDGRFLLLPRGLNQSIKSIVGRRYTKHHRVFFSYIFTHANDKRRIETTTNFRVAWDIDVNEKTLFERLGLNKYIKARQIGRARDILNSCFATAKKLGYCAEIAEGINKLGEKKYIIKLNRDKFKTLGNWKLKDKKELAEKK